MGRKVGGSFALFFGGAVSPSNTMAEAYLRTKWRLDPPSLLAATDMRRKLGAVLLFLGGGAGCPPNTMWPRPRPTSISTGIVIHPTAWPQHTNVADGETEGTYRQRSDRIGRTVLQTVAQN